MSLRCIPSLPRRALAACPSCVCVSAATVTCTGRCARQLLPSAKTNNFRRTLRVLVAHGQKSLSPAESGKIEVNGAQIYYERRGAGAHPILCMPGALGSTATDFPPQMEHFGSRNDFTIVGYDPRGYGKSRPSARQFSVDPLVYEADADDAVSVMRDLGFDRFSLLGWSDGGVSAIIAAAKYPKHMRKLVVWGANAFVGDEDVRLVKPTRDLSNWSARMKRQMEDVYGAEFPQLWFDWMDCYFGVLSDPERKGDLCKREVKRVSCPSLVAHGVKDAICPMFHAEYLARELRDSRYILFPDGKHNLHLKYAKEFNKLVEEFLNE